MLQPYFIQNKDWMYFWKNANNKISKSENHKCYFFESENLQVNVFEYPYILGSKFWYISKGPVLKSSFNIDNTTEYWHELLKKE